MKTGRIGSIFLVYLSLALSVNSAKGSGGNEPEIETLVKSLTSEDGDSARDARRKLEAKGAEVVPVLFGKLQAADWELKPGLLEVLSAHGREFAKQKLLNGNDTEKIYAALVYELTRAGQPDDYDTPEFKVMVEALLKAIKSEDKYLRAAAVVALIHDERSSLQFQYYYEIVPSLISSFDTDLVINRRGGFDSFATLLLGMCLTLDGLAGDRLAFAEATLDRDTKLLEDHERLSDRGLVRGFLRVNKDEIAKLRQYWNTWWVRNSGENLVELGSQIIERNLAILDAEQSADTQRAAMATGGLGAWTGESYGDSVSAWRTWWNARKKEYQGPPMDNRE